MREKEFGMNSDGEREETEAHDGGKRERGDRGT